MENLNNFKELKNENICNDNNSENKKNGGKDWPRKLLIFIFSLMILVSIPLGIFYTISEEERELDESSKIVHPKKQWHELSKGQQVKLILQAITKG